MEINPAKVQMWYAPQTLGREKFYTPAKFRYFRYSIIKCLSAKMVTPVPHDRTQPPTENLCTFKLPRMAATERSSQGRLKSGKLFFGKPFIVFVCVYVCMSMCMIVCVFACVYVYVCVCMGMIVCVCV